MNYEQAKSFWYRYLSFLRRNGSNTIMGNPMVDFTKAVKAGKMDDLDDETFYKAKNEASKLSVFWNRKPRDTVGNIFTTAIAKTTLADEDMENLSEILAKASEATEFYNNNTEEPEFDDDLWDEDYSTMSVYLWTPQNIFSYHVDHIYGQTAAKKAAAMLVYHHTHGHRRNIILAGPSGCGKTEIWRTLAQKFDCIKIINGPQLACDGWKGSYHISDIFQEEDSYKASHLIIVIDEADKLFEPAIGSGGTDFSHRIQSEFLKILDGDKITFTNENTKEKLVIDCSGVSTVFCGSFEHMLKEKTASSGGIGFNQTVKETQTAADCSEEDLIQYANIRREIAGRINQIITLDALDAADFEEILKGPASPIQMLEDTHHIYLTVDDTTRKALASEAEKSGLGCRYMRSKLQSLLDEQMFEKPETKNFTLTME